MLRGNKAGVAVMFFSLIIKLCALHRKHSSLSIHADLIYEGK